MRSTIVIKNKKVTSSLNLEDGTYNISIEKQYKDKTVDQVRKLWATCSDISEKFYGTKEYKDIIYLQVLKMAGQRTFVLTIDEDAIDEFKKQKGVRCVSILSRSIVNHKPVAMIEACMTGISEMDRKEVSKVIDTCCRYADEVGVIPHFERSEYGS